jgi:hypothetical protein
MPPYDNGAACSTQEKSADYPTTKSVTVTGKNLEGDIITADKTHPDPMRLFQHFVPEKEKYSNTIELYDALPKYTSKSIMEAERVAGIYLPIREVNFSYRAPHSDKEEDYRLEIRPARIRREDGTQKEFYPSAREELVEEALRKIAADANNGVYLDKGAGVQFSLSELRRELKKMGHAIRFDSLKESLAVCHYASISIIAGNNKQMAGSSIFPVLMMTNKEDWLKNPGDAKCYVQFNPLITNCVNKITYRQFDYATFMSLKSQLSRWLHKRLSHNYTGAELFGSYNILASTIIKTSNLIHAARFRDKIAAIDTALNELKAKRVIFGFKKETTKAPNGKIGDVKYNISPSIEFVEDMKKSHARTNRGWVDGFYKSE